LALGSLAGALGLAASAPRPAAADVAPSPTGLGGKRRVALPPINRRDENRCRWRNSKMGQANAARDKLFDLRECKNLAGSDASGKDIAGVLMNDGDFHEVKFEGTTMSKAVAVGANFEDANFKDAVVDRVSFDGSKLKNAIFKNALLTGTTFENADIENVDFTDAYIDSFGVRPLCANPTMKGTNPVTGADTAQSAGCNNLGLAR